MDNLLRAAQHENVMAEIEDRMTDEQYLIYFIYDPKQEQDDFKRLRFVITPMTKGADARAQKELKGDEYIDVSFSLMGYLGHDVKVIE